MPTFSAVFRDDVRLRIAYCPRKPDLRAAAGCRDADYPDRFSKESSMIQIIRNLIQRKSLEGALDVLADNTLYGWTCLRDQLLNQPPLQVEISANGRLLAKGVAGAFRGDLEAAGKRAGHCSFAILLSPAPPPGTVLEVTAVLTSGQRRAVPGSPITVPQASPNGEPEHTPSILPLPIAASGLKGSLDQCGPTHIRGWAHWTDNTNGPVCLSLYESGRELLQICANHWREDLAELRDGNGCCGFDVVIPKELCDGSFHVLDLRLRRGDSDVSVLSNPFRMRVWNSPTSVTVKPRAPTALKRNSQGRRVSLSIIVNFYNMQREAERTLTSLSREYQRDSEDFAYEVICIDNGSNPPLQPEWVEGFGPQFRVFHPSRELASPCAAINEAALQARGDYLAIMIDGAHLLTPGVFRETRQAWREHPDAVVAIRHWFIGGDQRWFAAAGYTQQMEDRLLQRIHWPTNGYELFRIGAPINEGPEPWLEGISESNCLMLPTSLYDRIGGMDEAFQSAGGGFANLDLWRRTSDAATGLLISLLGEASFHQFHGGTTTNVKDTEKDVRVRSYANEYRTLRGTDFANVPASRLHFRGSLPSEFAKGIRQRSPIPARLPITEQIRPGRLFRHFDEGAQSYLQSVYAESRLEQSVTWMGQPAGVAPADLICIQEIIHQLKPNAVVAISVESGLVNFVESVLDTMGGQASRILSISEAPTGALSPRVTVLHGQVDAPHMLASARHWTNCAETVMVLYAANVASTFSLVSLQAYSTLVSYRSYLVCLGTVFGQPWLGYSNRQPLQTIRDFIRNNPAFVVDRSRNQQLISTCPSGYLQNIGRPVTTANYNPTLDDFVCAPFDPEKV